MLKKFKGLVMAGVIGLATLGMVNSAEAAYKYVGSDTMKFTVDVAGNKGGGVHKSTGGKYQIRIPAQTISKYPKWAKTELYVTLYEMDGTKKQLIDQWVYRGADRVKEAKTITKDVSKWVDGDHAELKVYYHTNYTGGFTSKFYD